VSLFLLVSPYSRRVVLHLSAKNKISLSFHKLKEQNSALHLAVVSRHKMCVCVSVHIYVHVYMCENICTLEVILWGIILS